MKYILKISVITSLLLSLVACGESDVGASRIVLGTGNTVFELNELQYQLPFNVQVTEVDGNPLEIRESLFR